MKQTQWKVPAFLSSKTKAEREGLKGRCIDWLQDEMIAPLFIEWIQKKIEYLIAADEKAVEESTSEFELSSRLIGNLNKRKAYKDILKAFDTGEIE